MSGGTFGGFVLAGGRSSRMGSDKALLPFEGGTLLERAAETLQEAVGSAVIVGDRARYSSFGYEVIQDAFPGLGPLAGIQAALAWTASDWNLVVACDMPGLNAARLRELLRAAAENAEADVIIAVSDGRPQPLCSVYHRRGLPVIEEALRCGNLKVMQAIQSLCVVSFDLCDSEFFRNVNTRDEWDAVLISGKRV